MKKLLEYDPVTGTKKFFHADATGDNFMVETIHNDTDLVEANQAEYAATDERERWGDLTKVGSIPMWLYMKWQREGVIDGDGNAKDDTQLLRKLQDRDFLHFRTRPGRLV